jgi:hypothetical protein
MITWGGDFKDRRFGLARIYSVRPKVRVTVFCFRTSPNTDLLYKPTHLFSVCDVWFSGQAAQRHLAAQSSTVVVLPRRCALASDCVQAPITTISGTLLSAFQNRQPICGRSCILLHRDLTAVVVETACQPGYHRPIATDQHRTCRSLLFCHSTIGKAARTARAITFHAIRTFQASALLFCAVQHNGAGDSKQQSVNHIQRPLIAAQTVLNDADGRARLAKAICIAVFTADGSVPASKP